MIRNRARRRLKALVVEAGGGMVPGIYVFVAKKAINERPFSQIQNDFYDALKRMKLYKG